MAAPFGDRLWIVRKRVLAFGAVFFAAAAAGVLVLWWVSDAKADPGPIVYLFPVSFALVLGTFPTLAYFLNRWIKRFEVTNCPACGTFIWPTTIQALQVAMVPRCSGCGKRLGEPPGKGRPVNAADGAGR
jgi:hypothetical protein